MTIRAGERLERWLRERATVEREVSVLADLSGLTNATTAISGSRDDDFYVDVLIAGWPGTTFGTVTINGLDENGSAAQSVLTFTQNGRLRDTQTAFRSVTSAVTASFAGSGSVTIKATSKTGQPYEVLQTVKTIRCAVTRSRQGEILEPTGGAPIDSAIIMMFPNNGVRRNDRIVLWGDRWEVKAVRKFRNFRRERAMDGAIVFAENQT